jgi:hypothetical protein
MRWYRTRSSRPARAISIDVLPEAVWPWLVQVGCLRAGFYGNNLLDNLAHPSATTIATADVTPRGATPNCEPASSLFAAQ